MTMCKSDCCKGQTPDYHLQHQQGRKTNWTGQVVYFTPTHTHSNFKKNRLIWVQIISKE